MPPRDDEYGDEEELKPLPPTQITGPDDNGIKTIVKYQRNDNTGKVIKITRKIKVTKTVRKVNPHVEARKKWAKFGAAKGASQELNDNTTYLAEEVVIDLFPKEEKKEKVDPLAALKSSVSTALWRIKQRQSGDESMPVTTSGKEGAGAASTSGTAKGASSSLAQLLERSAAGDAGTSEKKDVYVPLHRRGGGEGLSGERFSDRPQRDDSSTVRVTNLSEDTREQDLRELFSPFGALQRVFLAKDLRGFSKGYAFINFYQREDAARAIEKLDGHGYDHLILRVEWAKPSTRPAN